MRKNKNQLSLFDSNTNYTEFSATGVMEQPGLFDFEEVTPVEPPPLGVQRLVEINIKYILDLNNAIRSARRTDARFNGQGRYESDVWLGDLPSLATKAQQWLDSVFIAKSIEMGFNHSRYLESLGYEPILEQSTASYYYIHH